MAHPDLDRMLEFCLGFAHETLETSRKLHLFATSVRSDGELQPQSIFPAEEAPDARGLIDQYIGLLKSLARSEQVRATALCYDSRISLAAGGKPKDAITVNLDHANGESLIVYQPYRKKLLTRIRYDPPFAVPGKREIFYLSSTGSAT